MRLATLVLVLLISLLLACSAAEPVDAPVEAEGLPAAALAPETEPEPTAAAERRAAPEFALANLDGDLVRSDELRGKIVVLDFWATWCPPCEFQVPELNAFRESHASEPDVVVLGVSVDVEGPEVVGEWVTQKDVQYDVLVGGEELARRFGALGFPTLYVLAPDGTIEMEHVGLIEVADLESLVTRLRSGS